MLEANAREMSLSDSDVIRRYESLFETSQDNASSSSAKPTEPIMSAQQEQQNLQGLNMLHSDDVISFSYMTYRSSQISSKFDYKNYTSGFLPNTGICGAGCWSSQWFGLERCDGHAFNIFGQHMFASRKSECACVYSKCMACHRCFDHDGQQEPYPHEERPVLHNGVQLCCLEVAYGHYSQVYFRYHLS